MAVRIEAQLSGAGAAAELPEQPDAALGASGGAGAAQELEAGPQAALEVEGALRLELASQAVSLGGIDNFARIDVGADSVHAEGAADVLELVAGRGMAATVSGKSIILTATGGGAGLVIEAVEELPETGDSGTLYLVPNEGSGSNVYDEYVWLEEAESFELIGTTEADLSDYVTETELETALSGKADDTDATTTAHGLMSAADKAKLDGIASGAQVNAVTGVKGDAESRYRTGDINLTPANIGAADADHTHNYSGVYVSTGGDRMGGTLYMASQRRKLELRTKDPGAYVTRVLMTVYFDMPDGEPLSTVTTYDSDGVAIGTMQVVNQIYVHDEDYEYRTYIQFRDTSDALVARVDFSDVVSIGYTARGYINDAISSATYNGSAVTDPSVYVNYDEMAVAIRTDGTIEHFGEVAYPAFSRNSWSTSSDQTTLPITPCFVVDVSSDALYWCDGTSITRINPTYYNTRVKGDAEASYRTGDVNLTPANIGAASASDLDDYLPLAGGTMTGDIDMDGAELQYDSETAYPTFVRSSWSTSSDESTLPVTPCFVLDTTTGGLYWCDGN